MHAFTDRAHLSLKWLPQVSPSPPLVPCTISPLCRSQSDPQQPRLFFAEVLLRENAILGITAQESIFLSQRGI